MISFLIFASVLPISLQQIASEKKTRSAIKRARKGLHIDTNDHFHGQILASNAYIEVPLFLKYEGGVLSLQPCVCLVSHKRL